MNIEKEKERIIAGAKGASKVHSNGKINDSEFCLTVLSFYFFHSLAEDWERIMSRFTQEQREIIRGFADNYFADNGYLPYPGLPGVTEAQLEEAAQSNKGKWEALHRWIIHATGG